MKVWPAHDPDETLKYSYDWTPDLAPGVTLVSAETTFTPVNLAGTVVVGTDTSGTVFTAMISGGNVGQAATYALRVKTTDGQLFEDTVLLPIMDSAALVPVAHPGGYVDPTPANLVALFPEFSTASQASLQVYLDRAARTVTTAWPEADFAYARMLLAAHLAALSGIGNSPEASAARNGSDQFKSMAIGSLRLDRFDAAKGGPLLATRYGRLLRPLLMAVRGGPRVTGRAMVGGCGDGDKAWY